ncbi:hypothetical protein [Niallia alba]|uniref:Uncharacterized protein n=1 Tax=Niallia alba TaxID=2729105 RepID=A0A7Y0K6E7_9BACI|nr:hypothetical protein [Niallia alba]NMO76387.1 hypothetical protein [Niallia alba]
MKAEIVGGSRKSGVHGEDDSEIVGGSGKSGVHREDESRNCWRKQEKWCSWRG